MKFSFSLKSTKFILAGFAMFIVLTALIVHQIYAGGGGPRLYLTSQIVGQTTSVDAYFNNSCNLQYKTKTYDRLVINVDFFNQITESIQFEDPKVTVKVNNVEIPGTISANYGSVLHWIPEGGPRQVTSYEGYQVTVTNGKIRQLDQVGFTFEFYNQGLPVEETSIQDCYFGWGYWDGFNDGVTEWSYIRSFYNAGDPTATPIPRTSPTNTPNPTATPSPTTASTPTPTPTRIPTSTPTPTQSPVPFDQIGLKDPGVVEVTVARGTQEFAHYLESTTATMFTLYGYPTSYGPGINDTPSSGGISPGGKTSISISVISTVPVGTYTGNQRVITNGSNLYSVYPVTVHVVNVKPTTIPSPTPTSTPTLIPVPVLSISNVTHSQITKNSATITWRTNVPATTKAFYGTSLRNMSQTGEISTLSTGHTMILSGLSAGKSYRYYVVSRDATGKTVVSNTYSFSTPRK